MDIKPIETVYNGHKFRSRLEARWSIFFDELGIKYEYEKEGYDLGEQGWYLPDFWLPCMRIWVEIKPSTDNSQARLKATAKAEALRDLTGNPCVVCFGLPKESWGSYYGYEIENNALSEQNDISATFVKTIGENPCLVIFNTSRSVMYCDAEKNLLKSVITIARATYSEIYCGDIDRFSDAEFYLRDTSYNATPATEAAIKARQARFEHGEKG